MSEQRINDFFLGRLGPLFCLMLSLASNVSSAELNEQQSHSMVGVHGMALFTAGDSLYASHMPLHRSIHAHQVILHINLPPAEKALVSSWLSQKLLVTIMPEVFDLQTLMDGKLKTFKADIFLGHFERDGELDRQKRTFTVESVIYRRTLNEQDNGHFAVVQLEPGVELLVHQIGKLPSFDQLLVIERDTNIALHRNGILELGGDSPVLNHDMPALSKKLAANKIEQVYLELRDFRID